MDDLIAFLNNHVSVRSFTEQQITPEQERIIIETAQRAPTSSNLQTYTIIGVRDQATKDKLMVLCHDQAHVAASSLFLVFCADLYRMTEITKARGYEPLSEYTDKFLTASMDATLVGGRALMAAQAMGLGGVMVGSIRIYTQEVCDLLGLPELVYPVMGLSLGYPKSVPKKKPRLSPDMIYHRERYNTALSEELLAAYDRELDAIGYLKGREVDNANYPNFSGLYSWREHSSRRMASQKFEALRPDLLQILRKRGFLLK